MRLFVVELDRFRSRGMVRWVSVVVLLGALLVGFSAFQAAKAPSAAQVADAQQQAQMMAQDLDTQVAECKVQQDAARKTEPQVDLGCDEMRAPTAEEMLPRRATFEDDGPTRLHGYWTVLLFVATGLGVSFLCAELTSGALGNWLTFEPRRTRVYVSKVAAAFVGTGVIATVGVAAVLAATYLGYALQGQVHAVVPPDVTPDPYAHLWGDLLGGAARTAVGAAVLATVGVALGTILRHTAAALGVIVGWLAFVDGLVMGLFHLSHRSLRVALQAWVEGTAVTYTDQTVCGAQAQAVAATGYGGVDDRGCTQLVHVLTAAPAGAEIAAVSLALLLVGWIVLRRRDVA